MSIIKKMMIGMDEIKAISDKEKSVMLARAMGWKVINIQTKGDAWLRVLGDTRGRDLGHRPPFGGGKYLQERRLRDDMIPDLYDPANMALAWRALNWLAAKSSEDCRSDLHSQWMQFCPEVLFEMQPAAAQREWLDKVLQLAMVVGLVEMTDE